MTKTKILVVDDEPNILILLKDSLSKNDFDVYISSNIEEAKKIIEKETIDIIILDIELGAFSGIDFCKNLKQNRETKNIPIIMITAKFINTDDIVDGFNVGADDYVTKPFKINILIARIHAILRRKGVFIEEKKDSLKTKHFTVNFTEYKIYLNKNLLSLTPKEFKILSFFISKQNSVIEKSLLMEQVWGTEYYGNFRTIDKHIENIRKKLGIYSECIETIPSIGFKFVEKI
jgi:DNA-binding response OmpR family regulator